MFTITVRTPIFGRTLPASDAREALQTMWMIARQDLKMTVSDEAGREVSMVQLEMLAAEAGRQRNTIDAHAGYLRPVRAAT